MFKYLSKSSNRLIVGLVILGTGVGLGMGLVVSSGVHE